jgi:hypothetical protein
MISVIETAWSSSTLSWSCYSISCSTISFAFLSLMTGQMNNCSLDVTNAYFDWSDRADSRIRRSKHAWNRRYRASHRIMHFHALQVSRFSAIRSLPILPWLSYRPSNTTYTHGNLDLLFSLRSSPNTVHLPLEKNLLLPHIEASASARRPRVGLDIFHYQNQ